MRNSAAVRSRRPAALRAAAGSKAKGLPDKRTRSIQFHALRLGAGRPRGRFSQGAVDSGAYFNTQSVEANEAGGVVLVIGLGRIGLHGRDVWIVEADWGFTAGGYDIAFVELQAHCSGHVFLALVHQGLQSEAFR